MPAERITDLLQAAEAQKNNPLDLDATVSLLSQRLLFEEPSLEDELAGYRYIRNLTHHPDEVVRRNAVGALEQRWNRVGLFVRHEPGRGIPHEDDDRLHFEQIGSAGFAHGLTEGGKVTILELARRQVSGQCRRLTLLEFEEVMTPLIGVWDDFSQVMDSFGHLFVLTDEAKYEPVIDKNDEGVKLSDEALKVLSPHLPVLEEISYPREVLSEEERRLIVAVKQGIAGAYERALAFFTEENLRGMTLPEACIFSPPRLDYLGKLLETGNFGKSAGQKQEVVYLSDEADTLFVLSHYSHPPQETMPRQESVGCKIYVQPDGGRFRQLTLDHLGELITGTDVGNLGFYHQAREPVQIQVTGIFASLIFEGVLDPGRIIVSPQGMVFTWNDISPKVRGLDLTVFYQRFLEGSPTGQSGQKFFISKKPTHIEVPEIKPVKPDSDSDASVTELVLRKISLDSDSDSVEVEHPKGKYRVSYTKSAKGVLITLTGRGWSREILIPGSINPLRVIKRVEEEYKEFIDSILEASDEIEKQIAHIRQLGLVEQSVHFGRNHRDVTSEDYTRLEELDQGLSQLDPDTQWVVKFYMACLYDMRGYKGDDERSKRRYGWALDDTKTYIRRIIENYSLNIPEELLVLVEEVFA